jgi:hypothetical protein
MATIKNIPDRYTINVPQMTINGNLTVNGGSTNVETTNTSILDNMIVLNNGETGSGVSLHYSGIEVDRGLSANVKLRWSEYSQNWELTNDGVHYIAIATSGAVKANIDITGYTLYDSANLVTLHTGTISSGGTGLYVDNATGTRELAAMNKAIAYSIIFG